jgi:hypothetical protein
MHTSSWNWQLGLPKGRVSEIEFAGGFKKWDAEYWCRGVGLWISNRGIGVLIEEGGASAWVAE